MKKEELKNKVDFKKIEEITFIEEDGEVKRDYLIDEEGNAIFPINPLQFKIIEKILELESRIEKLEKK